MHMFSVLHLCLHSMKSLTYDHLVVSGLNTSIGQYCTFATLPVVVAERELTTLVLYIEPGPCASYCLPHRHLLIATRVAESSILNRSCITIDPNHVPQNDYSRPAPVTLIVPHAKQHLLIAIHKMHLCLSVLWH